MKNLKHKRILITGAYGFLGKHLTPLFTEGEVIAPQARECDFRSQDMTDWYISTLKPHIIIHLAARVGGIGYNQKNPATLFYDNATMGINLMESARMHGVEKFVQVGTICAYPKITRVPFKESDLWNGYPEETNAPYGLAKKMLLVMAQAYRRQYGFNAIYLLPVNLYGPGDNFNPESSHVIPALIRKFVEAKRADKESVEVWGTGNATREFLFVKDAARAIYQATYHYNKPEPINVGSGMEISIFNLVTMIKNIVGFTGEVIFDTTKPDGQPRRCLDTRKAEREFRFKATTDFSSGLLETIQWYQQAFHP